MLIKRATLKILHVIEKQIEKFYDFFPMCDKKLMEAARNSVS
jgi:hypothetical protein